MPLCSSKKCISPARLVFITIHGVGIAIFANPFFVLPSTRSIVEIRGSRSQIDLPPPFSLGQWLKYGQAQGLPLRRTLIPFASDGSWNALRVDLIQDKERRSTFSIFFANCPAFSAETQFAIYSQHIGTESAKFAFDAFPALWCGWWHPLV